MKAFLSHSSKNKEFVREVANKLGRSHSILDERYFETGEEFQDSILKFLDRTSVFVFFATKDSLESFWVDFEIHEAFQRKIAGFIDKALVFVIDPNVSLSEIPNWLKKALIKNESSPAAVARKIKEHLLKSEQTYQRQYFIGRTDDTERLEDLLTPIDGSEPPKTFGVIGLPGYGRRTLLKKSVNDILGLNRIVEVSIEEGESLNDTCAKLADIIEPYSCQKELKGIVEKIQKLDKFEIIERIVNQLQNLIISGELPVFVDEGGLLDNNSFMIESLNSLVKKINATNDIYLGIVSSRRINKDNDPKIPTIHLEELKNKYTIQLLKKLSEDKNIGLQREELSELADYVHGYPPSAYFAINQASEYGKELLMSDKNALTNFSRKKFIAHIQEKELNSDYTLVLSMLASFSPLPLSVLEAINNDINKTHEIIYKLIDNSLVSIDAFGHYKIAEPIKISVSSLYGFPKKEHLDSIRKALINYINSAEQEKQLDLSRVLYRIGSWQKEEDAISLGIQLKSDLIKILEQAYHLRDYNLAIEYGMKALKEIPENQRARSYLVRALIQLEKWDAAEEQIAEMEDIAELRDIYFLDGFLERKRGRIQKAIEAFIESEKNGRKGPDIKRELAHCYLIDGNLELANTYIQEALTLQPDNNHILDMAAKVAIKQKDEVNASKYLDKLFALDDSEHYYLRNSTFHFVFGRYHEAVESAQKSINIAGKKFFSGRVQYIKSLTKNKEFEKAEKELNTLDSDFKESRHDIRHSLRCGFLMEKEDYERAFKQSNRIIDKQSKQYITIRKKCLLTMSSNMSLPFSERENYQHELEQLGVLNNDDIFEEIFL